MAMAREAPAWLCGAELPGGVGLGGFDGCFDDAVALALPHALAALAVGALGALAWRSGARGGGGGSRVSGGNGIAAARRQGSWPVAGGDDEPGITSPLLAGNGGGDADVEGAPAIAMQWRPAAAFAVRTELFLATLNVATPLLALFLQAQNAVPYPLPGGAPGGGAREALPSAAYLTAFGMAACWLACAVTLSAAATARLRRPAYLSLLWVVLAIGAALRLAAPGRAHLFGARHALGTAMLALECGGVLAAGAGGLADIVSRLATDAPAADFWLEPVGVHPDDLRPIGELYGAPLETAGLMSRLWFLYMDPVLRKAARVGSLAPGDSLPLAEKDTVAALHSRFESLWRAEVDAGRDPKLWRIFVRGFSAPFVPAAAFKFGYDVLQFAGPTVLHAVVTYMQGADEKNWWASFVPFEYRGYYFAGTLLCANLLATILLHQYFHRVYMVGMNLRSVTISSVYSKSLRLDSVARQQQPVGTIVNLMSADATRMQDLTTYLAVLWSGPIQITIAMVLLWRLMGVASLAGFGVAAVMGPMNAKVSMRMKKLQKRVMEAKDARVQRTNETMLNMKLVKCNAWEEPFVGRISEARKHEMRTLRNYMITRSFVFIVFTAAPLLVSLAAFSVYVLLGNELDAATAFTALSLFNVMRFPLAMLPNTINNVLEATVSLARIKKFLTAAEVDPAAVGVDSAGNAPASAPGSGRKLALSIEGPATFRWGADETAAAASASSDSDGGDGFALSDVSVSVARGELAAVVGGVGSGKSTLLSAFLGELHVSAGRCRRWGTVAYAPQTAFIFNGTLRENVTFGLPFDAERYAEAVDVCCLQADIDMLPAGDETEIGEQGINLSGGQRQRVSMARAVYRRADTYLLDDVLSAVDAHVGAAMFEKAIQNTLVKRGATVVLVTHGMQYVKACDTVIALAGGRVTEQGSFGELTRKGSQSQLNKLMATFESDLKSLGEGDEDDGAKVSQGGKGGAAPATNATAAASKGASAAAARNGAPTGRTLIKREERAVGSVSSRAYRMFVDAAGGPVWACFLLGVFTTASSTQILQNWWLTFWSDDRAHRGQGFYLAMYGVIGLSYLLLLVSRNILVAISSVRAGSRMHERLLDAVVRAPMSFFHTTPSGRLLNRFSQDTYQIDEKVGDSLSSFVNQLFVALSTVVVITMASGWFLMVVPPIAWFYVSVMNYFVPCSREIKRLDSVSRSPIYSHFQETLLGVGTIRAFGDQGRFLSINSAKVDSQQRLYAMSFTGNRWLAVRLENVGSAIIFSAIMLSVIGRHVVSPALAGLAISYALQITQSLNWLVRQRAELETQVVCVERVAEYQQLSPERASGVQPPAAWPSRGAITASGYSMAYREGLPRVLKAVSFDIKAGEKIGICGRTGAGKSSLVSALLRLADVNQGGLAIDGEDIDKLPLRALRSRLALIPQEAQLFGGTMRFNLDPTGSHTDFAMMEALRHVHLDDLVISRGGLDGVVAEDGENWSHGQRQLICTARALLQGAKVVMLDEATASCDVETDAVLQKTFREVFKDCTVLTIGACATRECLRAARRACFGAWLPPAPPR